MKVKRLEAKNPDQVPEDLQLFDDLYKGGPQFMDRIETYLPRRPSESPEHYKFRRDRAFIPPNGSSLIDYFAANLFVGKSRITLCCGEPIPEPWCCFLKDVDGRGKDWDFFWRKAFTRAMIDKWCLIGVSLPNRVGLMPMNRAQETEGDTIRPYLNVVKRRNVNDWERDELQIPLWYTLEYQHNERKSPEDERKKGPEGMTKKWIVVEREQVTLFKREGDKKGKPGPEEEAVADPSIEIPKMPLVELKIPHGMWVMGTTATMLLALFRKWNDLSWALQMGAYPMPIVYKRGGFNQVSGEGYFWQFEDRRMEGAEMLEPSGQSYAALASDIENLKQELYRVTHQMALAASTSPSASQQSGEAKIRDHLPTVILLRAYGAIVREKMEETLNLIATMRGDHDSEGNPLEFSVSGLDEFDVEDLASYLNNMTLIRTLNIPSATLTKVLQKNAALKAAATETEGVKERIKTEIEDANDPMENGGVTGGEAEQEGPKLEDEEEGKEDDEDEEDGEGEDGGGKDAGPPAEAEVQKEKTEHPQLTRGQARRIAAQHKQGPQATG